MVIVSPDVGFAKQARRYASFLGTSIAIADKERMAHDEKAKILQIIGDVRGKTAIVVDDFTISGGTLASVSIELMKQGAIEVYAAVTHGVLAGNAIERIDRSPLKRLFITDTVENQPVEFQTKSRSSPSLLSLVRQSSAFTTARVSVRCSRNNSRSLPQYLRIQLF